MTSSLVGSEMCIRDRDAPDPSRSKVFGIRATSLGDLLFIDHVELNTRGCLLYTSDAADDM
eukprot:3820543-Prorocentrum_lima.AAC.1